MRKTFTQARPAFCSDALDFTEGKTLTTAWRTCKVGSWLYFWLTMYRNVDYFEISDLLWRRNCYVSCWDCDNGRVAQRKAARVIRECYTMQGKRRSSRARAS